MSSSFGSIGPQDPSPIQPTPSPKGSNPKNRLNRIAPDLTLSTNSSSSRPLSSHTASPLPFDPELEALSPFSTNESDFYTMKGIMHYIRTHSETIMGNRVLRNACFNRLNTLYREEAKSGVDEAISIVKRLQELNKEGRVAKLHFKKGQFVFKPASPPKFLGSFFSPIGSSRASRKAFERLLFQLNKGIDVAQSSKDLVAIRRTLETLLIDKEWSIYILSHNPELGSAGFSAIKRAVSPPTISLTPVARAVLNRRWDRAPEALPIVKTLKQLLTSNFPIDNCLLSFANACKDRCSFADKVVLAATLIAEHFPDMTTYERERSLQLLEACITRDLTHTLVGNKPFEKALNSVRSQASLPPIPLEAKLQPDAGYITPNWTQLGDFLASRYKAHTAEAAMPSSSPPPLPPLSSIDGYVTLEQAFQRQAAKIDPINLEASLDQIEQFIAHTATQLAQAVNQAPTLEERVQKVKDLLDIAANARKNLNFNLCELIERSIRQIELDTLKSSFKDNAYAIRRAQLIQLFLPGEPLIFIPPTPAPGEERLALTCYPLSSFLRQRWLEASNRRNEIAKSSLLLLVDDLCKMIATSSSPIAPLSRAIPSSNNPPVLADALHLLLANPTFFTWAHTLNILVFPEKVRPHLRALSAFIENYKKGAPPETLTHDLTNIQETLKTAGLDLSKENNPTLIAAFWLALTRFPALKTHSVLDTNPNFKSIPAQHHTINSIQPTLEQAITNHFVADRKRTIISEAAPFFLVHFQRPGSTLNSTSVLPKDGVVDLSSYSERTPTTYAVQSVLCYLGDAKGGAYVTYKKVDNSWFEMRGDKSIQINYSDIPSAYIVSVGLSRI